MLSENVNNNSDAELKYQQRLIELRRSRVDSRVDFLHLLNISESNTNTTTLAGRPAYRLVYHELPFSNESRKVMELGTIINGRVYQASFSTILERFLQNLPIIQRILDTLELKSSYYLL